MDRKPIQTFLQTRQTEGQHNFLTIIILLKNHTHTHKTHAPQKLQSKTKVGLKLNIQETKIMASGPITSWQIVGETMETVKDFIFWDSKNHCGW